MRAATARMVRCFTVRRERTTADAARRTGKHRTMRAVPPRIVPALYAALKTLPLAHAAHVHPLTGLAVFHPHAVAHPGFVLRFGQAHFMQTFHGRDVGLLEMPAHRFVHALRLDQLPHPELRRFVAVLVFRAALDHNARPRLQYRAAYQTPVFGEDLGHAQLDSDDSVDCHRSRPSFSQHARSGYWLRLRDRKSTRLNSSHGYISYA